MRRLPVTLNMFLFVFLFCALAVGCASTEVRVISPPPETPTKLGPTRGTASGVLLFWILPCGNNSRTERAYKDALRNTNGATSLINVTLEEFWLNLGIGLFQQVIITGEAVK
ncbi:MAG: hypothetical protein WCP12_03340 [bacterium]